MDKVMNLSINPTYFCNFRCGFCYLTEEQLSDRKSAPLMRVKMLIQEIINAGYKIGHIDLYGGEVLLMSPAWLQNFKTTALGIFQAEDVEIITNGSVYNPEILEDKEFGISISYDFEFRQQHEHVWKNMLKMNRPFTVLTLGIPEIVRQDPAMMIEQLNMLENCHHWEIKPYSPNQANQLDVSYEEYEAFVKKIIEYPNKKFEFLNEAALGMAIHGDANPFSDDHVYITPNLKFGVLEFDDKDNEFFLELNSFDEYLEWTLTEKARVASNEFCGTCNYYGTCISEHLREVKSVEQSCNGFHNLIQWYGGKHGIPKSMENSHR